jgi:hypothetical protein
MLLDDAAGGLQELEGVPPEVHDADMGHVQDGDHRASFVIFRLELVPDVPGPGKGGGRQGGREGGRERVSIAPPVTDRAETRSRVCKPGPKCRKGHATTPQLPVLPSPPPSLPPYSVRKM